MGKKELPACTDRQQADGYKYDCGKCPECLEAIRILREQLTENREDEDSIVELDSPVCSMSGSERGAA